MLFAATLFTFVSCKKEEAPTGIKRIYSPVDFNNNGKDDYTDFLNGARADAVALPTYDDSYFEGGYPPDGIGVCSDVIWRAFREAGYSLKDMVDADVARDLEAYVDINRPDPNIDFRRVVNLRVFFGKYAISLTTDIDAVEEWQPGDIVVFGRNTHIGIVSDKRDAEGHAYIIHNSGQSEREEDYLGRQNVAAHYRFDASRVPGEVLYRWSGK